MKTKSYHGEKKPDSLTTFEKNKLEQYQSRINRWHDKHIEQLSFSINMVFTLSIAIIGFILNEKSNNVKYQPSLKLLVWAIIIGAITLLTRFFDFKYTKDKAKIRKRIFEVKYDIEYYDYEKQDGSKLDCKLSFLECLTKTLGYITLILFVIQIILLIIAIFFMVFNNPTPNHCHC